MEVVVTDDGSMDETEDVVRRIAGSVTFPVAFTTHPHRRFHLARCRNEGVRASSAPYLLFSDGDCLFSSDHLRQHLGMRRRDVAWSADCLHLDRDCTQRIDDDVIASGEYRAWVSSGERRRIQKRRIKDRFYQAIRHPRKPKLTGSNIAMWRSDFERINGFDENFSGWGCEDDDLADRLRALGVRVASSLSFTRVFHMWHRSDPSQPAKWSNGANVGYLQRENKPIRCATGLSARDDCRADTRVVKFAAAISRHRAA